MNDREVTPIDGAPVDAEPRGIPQIGRSRRGGKWGWLVLIALGVVLALALGAQAMVDALRHRHTGVAHQDVVSPALPDLTHAAFDRKAAPPPDIEPVPPSLPLPAPAPVPPKGEASAEEKAAHDRAERRIHSPVLVRSGTGTGEAAASPGNSATAHDEPTASSSSSLGGALSATRNRPSAATVLDNPDMMVTQGMFADCILQTAINSSLPGMTSCVLDRNVYSTNGRVLLLERGSRVVGQYQSEQLRAGMKRIFVLWTRIETPLGVLVTLDSPGTDALGRSGVDGDIDTHFWERFGAALLVSVVDDLSNAAGRQSGGTSVSFNSTANTPRDAASIIVQNSMNIPPTLDRAQGGHLNIFVARDLDFSHVYELAAAGTDVR